MEWKNAQKLMNGEAIAFTAYNYQAWKDAIDRAENLDRSDAYFDWGRKHKNWNIHDNFVARFLRGEFKDKHPVTLEPLDYE